MAGFRELRDIHLSDTKEKLSRLPDDFLIVNVVRSLDEVSRVIKILDLRFKEWSVYYSRSEGVDRVLDDFGRELKSWGLFHKKLNSYLLSLMKKRCPHLVSVSGHVVGARLIAAAGSLEKLSRMPSSKIQVLGAEKALFRHLKTGSKPPKYGIIFLHGSVVNAVDKGRAARKLSSKIAIAARQDFYI
jgi:nucleolar protein 56